MEESPMYRINYRERRSTQGKRISSSSLRLLAKKEGSSEGRTLFKGLGRLEVESVER